MVYNDEFEYEIVDGEVHVTGPIADVHYGEDGEIELIDYCMTLSLDVPSAIEGLPVTHVGGFSGCPNLSTVTLPEGLEVIDMNAFESCPSLVDLSVSSHPGQNIPSTVTAAGAGAFYNTGLASVTIPKGPGRMSSRQTTPRTMAYSASARTSRPSRSRAARRRSAADGAWRPRPHQGQHPLVGDDDRVPRLLRLRLAVGGQAPQEPGHHRGAGVCVLRLADGRQAAVRRHAARHGGLRAMREPGLGQHPQEPPHERVLRREQLVQGPFFGCAKLKDVTFDGGIETIPRGLFEHVGMERVTIPDTVRTIEYCAFWGCDKLTSVKLGDGVEVIEAEAFQDCTALAGDLMLPESLRYIGDGAFAGCASIQAVNIPVGLATDEYCGCDSGHRGPFWGCSGIRDVSFDAGTTVVPNGLFYGCDGIESLTIPDTVASIGDNAFYRMTSLGSIKLPNGLVHLGSY
ncbi:MAG: leucine-rich repeat domain-containing protein, partial [Atopobiaceae bacterium]|nr:leucine-rich repeat domain-containing protein [Atopobiaceae bacterium]